MRKLILIAALVLASASARAGDTRSLSLASSEPPAAAQQAPDAQAASKEMPKAAETPAVEATKAETPRYVDRPAAVSTTPEAAKVETAKPETAKPVVVQTSRSDRSKRRPYWTEARIIGELHRHGVYW